MAEAWARASRARASCLSRGFWGCRPRGAAAEAPAGAPAGAPAKDGGVAVAAAAGAAEKNDEAAVAVAAAAGAAARRGAVAGGAVRSAKVSRCWSGTLRTASPQSSYRRSAPSTVKCATATCPWTSTRADPRGLRSSSLLTSERDAFASTSSTAQCLRGATCRCARPSKSARPPKRWPSVTVGEGIGDRRRAVVDTAIDTAIVAGTAAIGMTAAATVGAGDHRHGAGGRTHARHLGDHARHLGGVLALALALALARDDELAAG